MKGIVGAALAIGATCGWVEEPYQRVPVVSRGQPQVGRQRLISPYVPIGSENPTRYYPPQNRPIVRPQPEIQDDEPSFIPYGLQRNPSPYSRGPVYYEEDESLPYGLRDWDYNNNYGYRYNNIRGRDNYIQGKDNHVTGQQNFLGARSYENDISGHNNVGEGSNNRNQVHGRDNHLGKRACFNKIEGRGNYVSDSNNNIRGKGNVVIGGGNIVD